ncbi:hypothetical protein Tco_0536678 [Tanacetum coccineum]
MTCSSPLMQTGMVDFVSGRAVIEVTQRKCIKYEAKCADIGYGFIPFSFSSFGELENDAVTLLNQIQKFFVTSGILAGKEIDIELGEGLDKPLRPADMLLYSWDKGFDVCVDLTGFSPLTQTGMVDFVPGRAVFDATHPKRVKYKVECSVIGYDFLAFLFSLLGELEKDAVAIGLTEADSKVLPWTK